MVIYGVFIYYFLNVTAHLSMQMEAQCLFDHGNPMTACQVTHCGAEINLPETGISLAIPEGAIPEGSSFEIYLSLSLDDDYPELEEGHTLICPIVRCKPHGIRFLKPATLTLPCNAVNDVEDDLTIWESKTAGIKTRFYE